MDRDIPFGLYFALDSLEFRWVQGWELLLGKDQVDEVLVKFVGVKLEVGDFVLLNALDDGSTQEGHL